MRDEDGQRYALIMCLDGWEVIMLLLTTSKRKPTQKRMFQLVKESWKEMYHGFHKNIKQNKQICILEGFLLERKKCFLVIYNKK